MTTEVQALRAGKEVLSYCGRCKLPLAHIIVTMKTETRVGQCECKTCKAKHNYRDPDKVAKKAAPAVADTRWKDAMEKGGSQCKPYAMDQSFEAGECIQHSVFGKGLVERIIAANKIDVLFEDTNKILICAISA
jgi:hypothetical protein